MKLKITKDFAFAHRGCDVVQYQAGTEIETDDQDLIDVALAERWAVKPRAARESKDAGLVPPSEAVEPSGTPDAPTEAGPVADPGLL